MRTTYQEISAGWRVRDVQEPGGSPSTKLPWLPAEIPGHVHLDLIRAGVIADPLQRLYERGAAWVDETDWIYETTFPVDSPAPTHAYLHFKGLDTIAEIELNGEALGYTDNMFIPHEFAVGGRLKDGENTLRVTLRAALRVGRERRTAWGEDNDTIPDEWFVWGPRSFVRKAQYMYGWDWGPEPVSCGLWRPVELVTVPTARLLDWKYDVEFADDGKAVVTVTTEVERAPDAADTPLTFTAALTGVTMMQGNAVDAPLPAPAAASVPAGAGRQTVSVSVTVDDPQRWWPHGYNAGTNGHPPLYTLAMSLATEEGEADQKTAKVGLRTIELLHEPDADGRGEGFKFRVNGTDIFIKGANWIPDDSFPARLVNESVGTALLPHDTVGRGILAACEANFNMLRVWGGGLYESEHFYELCDAHGLLVWQDFAYGCAYYPDKGEYAEAARVEATAAVRRIRNHPSLAIWCGNNENDTMYYDKWNGRNPSRYLGGPIYHEILPAVVAAEDSKTPYWPSSPFGGDSPNSPDFGDRHNWDVWHGVGDWTNYLKDNSRFCSEFGFASSCGLAAWDKCLTPADKDPYSAAVRWHDKTRKGYETYLGLVQLHYPAPQTLEDLVYYTQINQMEALKCGVEHYRRLKGRCWGTLYWQINDCWPTQSWAVIDSTGEPKAAYYASKKFYAPVLLSLNRNGETHVVEAHLTNDLLQAVRGTVTLTLETFDGETLHTVTSPASADANGTAAVAALPLDAAQGRENEVFVHASYTPADGGETLENIAYLGEPKDWRLADPGVGLTITESDEYTFAITLTAKRFAPYVWLRRTDNQPLAGIADNFFHLRGGQTRTLIVEKTDEMQRAEDVRGYLVLRTL